MSGLCGYTRAGKARTPNASSVASRSATGVRYVTGQATL